eukprot:592223_1
MMIWIVIDTKNGYLNSFHGITNGLLRVKLSNTKLLNSSRNGGYRRLVKHVSFKLQYKQSHTERSDETEWKSVIFDHSYIKSKPETHLNIRVDTNLYDYNLLLRMTAGLSDAFCRRTESIHILAMSLNKWLPWSNTVAINVPSSMKDMSFEIGEWIRFLKPSTGVMSHGTIRDKVIENEEECSYKILHYRNGKTYDVKHKKSDQNMKHLSAHCYIDVTNIKEMEEALLIGDRMNVDTQFVTDVYHTLNDVFYREYVMQYMKPKGNGNDVHLESMSKCVALNVMNMLWIKDKGYKMKCLLFGDDHSDDRIELMSQREYAIGSAMRWRNKHYYYVYYCDVCLCVQGDYYWMYRCRKSKDTKYNGHDLCLKCVYHVIKQNKQLIELLNCLLMDHLTTDCIQTIVFYTAGHVVKL